MSVSNHVVGRARVRVDRYRLIQRVDRVGVSFGTIQLRSASIVNAPVGWHGVCHLLPEIIGFPELTVAGRQHGADQQLLGFRQRRRLGVGGLQLFRAVGPGRHTAVIRHCEREVVVELQRLLELLRGLGKPAVIGQVASLFEMVDSLGGFRRNGNFRGRLRWLGCRPRRGTGEEGNDSQCNEQPLHKNLLSTVTACEDAHYTLVRMTIDL